MVSIWRSMARCLSGERFMGRRSLRVGPLVGPLHGEGLLGAWQLDHPCPDCGAGCTRQYGQSAERECRLATTAVWVPICRVFEAECGLARCASGRTPLSKLPE